MENSILIGDPRQDEIYNCTKNMSKCDAFLTGTLSDRKEEYIMGLGSSVHTIKNNKVLISCSLTFVREVNKNYTSYCKLTIDKKKYKLLLDKHDRFHRIIMGSSITSYVKDGIYIFLTGHHTVIDGSLYFLYLKMNEKNPIQVFKEIFLFDKKQTTPKCINICEFSRNNQCKY